MHTLGRFVGAQRSINGDLQITFAIDDDMQLVQELDALKDKDMVLDAKVFREKRSLQANRYLWKLCDLIAKKLGSDKETIYLMKLKEYGVFNDYAVTTIALDDFRALWRYTEVLWRYKSFRLDEHENMIECEMAEVRCWTGSHEYDTKQMSDLLNGVVQDAKDIGVETWTQEEIDSIIDAWKGV